MSPLFHLSSDSAFYQDPTDCSYSVYAPTYDDITEIPQSGVCPSTFQIVAQAGTCMPAATTTFNLSPNTSPFSSGNCNCCSTTPTTTPITVVLNTTGTVATPGERALNVHREASRTSPVIGTIPYAASVSVSESTGVFYKVTYNNLTGYVLKQYIRLAGSSGSTTMPSTTIG